MEIAQKKEYMDLMQQLASSIEAAAKGFMAKGCCCRVPAQLKASLVTNKAFAEIADEIPTVIHICQAAISPLLHRNVSPLR